MTAAAQRLPARRDPARDSTPLPSPGRQALALVLLLVIAYAVAALGTLATLQNVDGWYADADRAPWSPPNTLFGPMWTLLYALMSVSAWLVWRRGGPLRLYVTQLVLNALWTPVFFGLFPTLGAPALWAGLVIIVAMDIVVLLTMIRFSRVSLLAAWLLVPYWAWILFATTLNGWLALHP